MSAKCANPSAATSEITSAVTSAGTSAESARLDTLHALRLLDTLPEAVYDDIVRLAAQICRTPIGMVSLVDRDRVWFKARLGMASGEWRGGDAFCVHAIATGEPLLVVEDAARDPRFKDSAPVTGAPGVRFYAGAPIVMPNGQAMGTVCVLDTVPRTLDAAQRRSLQALARQTAALLELRQHSLHAEQQAGELTRLSNEAALRLGAQRLALALASTRMAVFDWDLATGRVYRGANLAVMRGGSAGEVACTIEEVQALIHPADVPGVRAAMRSVLSGATGAYEFEHRIRRVDAGWVWINATGRVTERGPGGRALRLSGIDEDVSVRKAAERLARDSLRKLHTIANSLPALIAHIDNEERYRFLNAHIARVFGIDIEATLGRTMREVRGEATYAALAPHVAAALRGETTSFAYADRVGGVLRHYQSHYIPNLEAAGQVQGFHAMTFDITELQETQTRLELLARVDTLTGVANRRQFDERMAQAMSRTRRTLQPMAVLYLDIDHFKSINDARGHAVGDAVLCEFARRLEACVRVTDTVARLAGDEFVILLEGIAGGAEAGRVAAKVVACIRAPFEVADAPLTVTASVGVAPYEGAVQTAAEVLALADRALYRAKKLGRDRFVLV